MICSSLAFLRDNDFASSKIGPSKERSSRTLICSVYGSSRLRVATKDLQLANPIALATHAHRDSVYGSSLGFVRTNDLHLVNRVLGKHRSSRGSVYGSSLGFVRTSDLHLANRVLGKHRSSRGSVHGSSRLTGLVLTLFVLLVASEVQAQDAGFDASPDVADASIATDAAVGFGDAGIVDQVERLPRKFEPQCELGVKPQKISTGEVTTLAVSCKLIDGTRATLAKEQRLEPLELIDQHTLTKRDPRSVQFELDLLALAPGTVELPGITFHINAPDGKRYSWTTPQSLTIDVASVLGNEPNAQPKPARPPVSVVEDDYTLAYVGGGLLAALLVALLTLLISRWWRARTRSEPPPPPPTPPWQLAQQELKRLRLSRERAFEEGGAEQWVDALSDTMRKYLGARYGFEGLESTTDELLAQLQRVRAPELSLPELSALLGDWDLIKFARATPNAEQCEEWVERALGIVSQTIPHVPPPTENRDA